MYIISKQKGSISQSHNIHYINRHKALKSNSFYLLNNNEKKKMH